MEAVLRKGADSPQKTLTAIIEASPRKAQALQAMQNLLSLPAADAKNVMVNILTDLIDLGIMQGRCSCGGFLSHTGNPLECEYRCCSCGAIWVTKDPIPGVN